MNIDLKNVSCGYDNKVVQSGISFTVKTGEICCLLGPNGVGKTTLFRTMLGFIKRLGGEIMLDGADISTLSPKSLAKQFGYVPQVQDVPFPYTVEEVVTMGRIAHMGIFSVPGPKDREIAESVIETLGIGHLKKRLYTEISGGEKQMTLIARALTQQPAFLVMDEPTANLDFGNQIRVLRQINRLAAQGLGIVMTTHFPDHAFQCRSKVLLLQKEKPFLYGDADEVVTSENMESAYGVRIEVTDIRVNGGRIRTCVPLMEENVEQNGSWVRREMRAE